MSRRGRATGISLVLAMCFALAASAGEMKCTACHSKERAAGLHVQPVAIAASNLDDVVYQRHCVACHRPDREWKGVSGGHRIAASYFHHSADELAELAPEAVCMLCHGGEESQLDMAADSETLASAPAVNLHASHPMMSWSAAGIRAGGYGLRKKPADPIRLVEGRVSCVSCHDLAGGQEFALATREGRNELCLDCHRRVDPSTSVASFDSAVYFR